MPSKARNKKKSPFRPAHQIGVGSIQVGPRERKYLNQVIRTNRLSYGPMSRKLEAQWARVHDSGFSIFCNSGTSALHLALAALKEKYNWKDGDEVLVPAVTFVATSNIVLHNNMKPVFVDVDPLTYNIDPKLIEAKITRRTRAMIPVHLLGLPCDMTPIMAIARKHRLRVIEDSCETTFARYKGKAVGSFGDIGCFSTYVAHYIVTGVGGFATTSNKDLAVRLRSLMNHGRDSIYISIDDDKGAAGKRLNEIVKKRFSFVSLGHSFRCTELEAAIGLGQMEQKTAIARARKANAKRLTESLRAVEDKIQLPTIPKDREHMFMMYPIVVRKGTKTGLVRYLEKKNIETRDMLPLTNQPVYKKLFPGLEQRYPVARWLNKCAFYVGCHQDVRKAEIDYIARQVRAYYGR